MAGLLIVIKHVRSFYKKMFYDYVLMDCEYVHKLKIDNKILNNLGMHISLVKNVKQNSISLLILRK